MSKNCLKVRPQHWLSGSPNRSCQARQRSRGRGVPSNCNLCHPSLFKVTSDDVILCSGCSCALDIAISTLADDGQNILVPRPGFPLYTTLSAGLGIQTREYDLLPDHDWMVDLGHMESLIDHNTAAIIVNSPSNPCGSVFSPAHLRQILDIAERHKVPIIGESTFP